MESSSKRTRPSRVPIELNLCFEEEQWGTCCEFFGNKVKAFGRFVCCDWIWYPGPTCRSFSMRYAHGVKSGKQNYFCLTSVIWFATFAWDGNIHDHGWDMFLHLSKAGWPLSSFSHLLLFHKRLTCIREKKGGNFYQNKQISAGTQWTESSPISATYLRLVYEV